MLSPVRPPSILQAHRTSLGGSTLGLYDFFKKNQNQDRYTKNVLQKTYIGQF